MGFFPPGKNLLAVGHDTGVRRLPGSVHCLEFDTGGWGGGVEGGGWRGGGEQKEKQKSSDVGGWVEEVSGSCPDGKYSEG